MVSLMMLPEQASVSGVGVGAVPPGGTRKLHTVAVRHAFVTLAGVCQSSEKTSVGAALAMDGSDVPARIERAQTRRVRIRTIVRDAAETRAGIPPFGIAQKHNGSTVVGQPMACARWPELQVQT